MQFSKYALNDQCELLLEVSEFLVSEEIFNLLCDS